MAAGRTVAESDRGRSPARVRVEVLGRFAVFRDGERLADRGVASRKGRTLLKVLVLHPDEAVSIDRLADIIWSGEPPAHAARSIASLVSRRRSLVAAPPDWRLRPCACGRP